MEGLGLIIMGIGVILFLFIGWWALIPIAIGAVIFWIIRNWDKVKDVFQNFLDWFKGTWQGKIIAAVWNTGKKIITTLVDAIKSGIQFVKNIFNTFKDWLKQTWLGQMVSNMLSAGKKLISGLISGIKSMASAVKDALLGLVPKWARKLFWKTGQIFKSTDSAGGSSSGISGNNTKSFNDMIWRPGQAPISISPQDTLVATKNGPIGGGGESQIINVTSNNTVNVMDKSAFERILDERDRKLMDNLRRLNTL